MLYSAYRAFGAEPSPTYADAVATLRGKLLPCEAYVRPPGKTRGAMRDMAWRGPFVVHDGGVKRGRLVKEHHDKEEHMRQAAEAQLPSRADRSAYSLRADTKAAVRECLQLGGKLPAWRKGQRRVLNQVRIALEPENAVLRGHVASSSGARAVAGNVNVALLCALVDALEWPDTMLPINFVRGFKSVGNVPDSGVFRAVEPEPTQAEFDALYEAIDATNGEWLDEVCSLLGRRAYRADSDERANIEELFARSMKEVDDGLVGAPMTKAQLLRKYTRDGRMTARVLPRFGVRQRGGKLRAIDDARMSRTNEMQRMLETIVTPSPEFPAHVLHELARACVERGVDVPNVELGLDDLFAAYRRVPTSQNEFMIAAVWCPAWDEPAFFEVHGHAFGLVSSVVNFNRVPHLLCVAAARLFAAPVDHFFDDYLTVDLAVGRGSAQLCVDELHKAVRLELEPKKRKLSDVQQVELGVACDLRRAASHREVSLAPTPDRIDEFIADLEACERAGRMDPAEAESLFGRISFMLSSVAGAVGRAATQPLLQRSHEGKACTEWTRAMACMKRFMAALLPVVPPLVINVEEDSRPAVLVYTDACYSEAGYSGVGIVVVDGERVAEAGAEVPAWLLAWLRPRGQQINHLEAVAAACARLTFPDMLRGRRVLHFIDNTVALSKTVHGYANEPDMAAATSALHLCDAMLGVDSWFEWVPSHANISDLPSRDAATWDAEARAVMARLRTRVRREDRREVAFPSAAELDDPSVMLERARRL